MLRFAALLLGLTPLLAACGDNRGHAVAYADFDQALQQARCERAARCGTFTDEATCMTFYRVVPDVNLGGAIKADKVHYDGQQAQQCIDATAKQSCDLTATDSHIAPPACSAMYGGTIKGGESCSIDAECASGTCSLPTDCPTTGCCVGACRPVQEPASAGGSCAKNHDCASGLVCATDGTCRKPGGDGAACGSDRECAEGLGCTGAAPVSTGVCHRLPHAGEACPYQRCADENLRCDATSHQCVAVGKLGDACPTGIECATGLECDPTSLTCREFPTLGMPCTSLCGGEAFCSEPPRMCVGLSADKTPCDGYNECVSFYCQQGVGPVDDDTCQEPPVCF